MILEIATLDIKPALADEFAATIAKSAPLLARQKGYISHEITRCLESPHRYVLLIRWQRVEDHTVGFRQSPEYQEWKTLTHHFFEPFPPMVQHYQILG
jgi:heme-degrading monooxygenase HmoA